MSFDSRKKDGEVGRRRLENAAEQIIHDAEKEGFVIVTGSGKHLTSEEVRLSKKVQIPPYGKSVSRADARNKLEEYLDELKFSGMLEQ